MLLHGPPARLNVTRRHVHSLLSAVDTITASSPRSSTSSSVEFWSCCSLTSSFGVIGFPSSPRPSQTTEKGPTETRHHPEKAPNSPQMYRPREGGISHHGGGAGSLYGTGPSGSVCGSGSKGHGATRKSAHSRSRLLEEMGIRQCTDERRPYAVSAQVHVLCVSSTAMAFKHCAFTVGFVFGIERFDD